MSSPTTIGVMAGMSAALEIAERFNPRKMPWIFSIIEKHMLGDVSDDEIIEDIRKALRGLAKDTTEACAQHVENNFNAPDIAASIRENVS